jgi:hypothetical protein
VSFSELVVALQRLSANEREAARDAQAIAQTHDAELAKAAHRRDAAMAEIEKALSAVAAIRRGAEADFRKQGLSEAQVFADNVESRNGPNQISELPALMREIVRKAREIDDRLQLERRTQDIEARAKNALAELARQPPAIIPVAPPVSPPPQKAQRDPRPRVSLPVAVAIPSAPAPALVAAPKVPSRQKISRNQVRLWVAAAAVVALLVSLLLYLALHSRS